MDYTLYDMAGCPYCMRVKQAAAALGIRLKIVDTVRQPEARQMLIRRLGRGTVPVLGIPEGGGDSQQERLLPESRDIIAFFQRHAEDTGAGASGSAGDPFGSF